MSSLFRPSERATLLDGRLNVSAETLPRRRQHMKKYLTDWVVSPMTKVYCLCRLPQGRRAMIQCAKCFIWYHNQCIGLAEHLLYGLKDSEVTYFCGYNGCNSGVPFCSVQGHNVKLSLATKYNNVGNDVDTGLGCNTDSSQFCGTVVYDDGDNFACDGTDCFTDHAGTDGITDVSDGVVLADSEPIFGCELSDNFACDGTDCFIDHAGTDCITDVSDGVVLADSEPIFGCELVITLLVMAPTVLQIMPVPIVMITAMLGMIQIVQLHWLMMYLLFQSTLQNLYLVVNSVILHSMK